MEGSSSTSASTGASAAGASAGQGGANTTVASASEGSANSNQGSVSSGAGAFAAAAEKTTTSENAGEMAAAVAAEGEIVNKSVDEKQKKEDHLFIKRLKEKYKKDYQNPEEALDDAENYVSENERILNEFREDDKIMYDVVVANPVIAKIVYDLSQGATLEEALALHVDLDLLKTPDGEPDRAKWAENAKTRKENAERLNKLKEEIDVNIPISQQEFDNFKAESKLDDEMSTNILNLVNEILSDAYKGKVSRKVYEMIHWNLTKDKDITAAREEGIINGRNEKIDIIKEKESANGDGLPHVESAAAEPVVAEKVQREKSPIETTIDEFNRKRQRWV